jgi:hypothetical protein
MNFISLKWFKEKIKSTVEKAINNRIDLAVEQLEKEESQNNNLEVVTKKPYLKVKMVNNLLTVVFEDGKIVTKSNADEELYNKVVNSTSVEEIEKLMMDEEAVKLKEKLQKEVELIKSVQKGIDKLKQSSHFVENNRSVYLKGINRSMPQLLVEKFCEILSKYEDSENLDADLEKDEEFNAHKRFFMWCCLNPRAEVADLLYGFLMKNSFRITKQGFFAALRNVVTVRQDNQIVHFVSNSYNKVKAVWKKKPSKYRVVKTNDGEYLLEKVDTTPSGTLIGNLETLYNDLPNMEENRFTDDWTKTFDIRVGKVVNMPIEECNWSTQDCAASGLHFTADQINYVGCGDQSMLILINPMKVVGIGEHKGRCYEYLPIMTVPRSEATELLHDLDFDTLELDESYAVRELDDLVVKVKEGFAAETKKYTFNLPSISVNEINTIVNSLDAMKKELSKRIVKID